MIYPVKVQSIITFVSEITACICDLYHICIDLIWFTTEAGKLVCESHVAHDVKIVVPFM